MGTRKQVREQLVTLFDADSTFTTVYGYAPIDLRGTTKVLCVYSDRSRHEMISKHLNNNFYVFFVESYVKRVNGENSEDALDDMHEAIRAVIRANIGDSTWNELNLEEESEAFFAQVAGVPYRVERHELLVKVTQS
jgi:hypothetical protein